MKAQLVRFTSRKFMVTLAAVFGAMGAKQYMAAAAAAAAYVLGEAHVDAKAARVPAEEFVRQVVEAADALEAGEPTP